MPTWSGCMCVTNTRVSGDGRWPANSTRQASAVCSVRTPVSTMRPAVAIVDRPHVDVVQRVGQRHADPVHAFGHFDRFAARRHVLERVGERRGVGFGAVGFVGSSVLHGSLRLGRRFACCGYAGPFPRRTSMPLRRVCLVILVLARPAAAARGPAGAGRRHAWRSACKPARPATARKGAPRNAGYFPRIAGKPAGYLYNQLLNFRDGRRRNAAMSHLVQHLSDAYLREIAALLRRARPALPAAPAAPTPRAGAAAARRGAGAAGRRGARHSGLRAMPRRAADRRAARRFRGCWACRATTSSAQLGAWRTGQRKALAPDCMAEIVGRLTPRTSAPWRSWLAAQPLPAGTQAAGRRRAPLPLPCGSAASDERDDRMPAPLLVAARVLAALALLAARRLVAWLNLRGEEPLRRRPAATAATPAARSRAAATSRSPATAPAATPRAAARRTPAAAASRRRSAPCSRPTSRRTRDRHRRAGARRSSGARCTTAARRTAACCIPAFPYPSFTRVTREDSDAIYAYLRSVPPVSHAEPRRTSCAFPTTRRPRWPCGARSSSRPRALRARTGQAGRMEPRRLPGATGLGHCVACHGTPQRARRDRRKARSSAGGLIPMRELVCAVADPPREAGVRRLGRRRSGGAAQDRRSRARLGHGADGRGGLPQHPAPERRRPARDGRVPPGAAAAPPQPRRRSPRAADAGVMERGAKIYDQHCAYCHGDRGRARRRLPGAGRQPRRARWTRRTTWCRSCATAASCRHRRQPAPLRHAALRATCWATTRSPPCSPTCAQSWGNAAAPVSALDVLRVR